MKLATGHRFNLNNRRYEYGTMVFEGIGPRAGIRIGCFETGCAESFKMLSPTIDGDPVDFHRAVERRFEKKLVEAGWSMKSDFRHCRCPKHTLAAIDAKTPSKPEPPPMKVSTNPLVGMELPPAPPAAALPGIAIGVSADPPPTATPAQRRLIMDKLEAMYLIDKQRYRGATTDKSMGAELKMPAAWVARIREEFFGPEANESQEAGKRVLANMDRAINEAKEKLDSAIEIIAKAESDLAAFRRDFK